MPLTPGVTQASLLSVQTGSQEPCFSANKQGRSELVFIVMAETPVYQHRFVFFLSAELYYKDIFETYWENTSTLKNQMNGNGRLHTYMYSCYLSS